MHEPIPIYIRWVLITCISFVALAIIYAVIAGSFIELQRGHIIDFCKGHGFNQSTYYVLNGSFYSVYCEHIDDSNFTVRKFDVLRSEIEAQN